MIKLSRVIILLLLAVGCASGEGRRERPQNEAVPSATDASIEWENYGFEAQGTGTAFLVSDRHVVTNFHVIDGANAYYIALGTVEKDLYKTEVRIEDPTNDLAVLEITDSAWRPQRHFRLAPDLPDLGSEVFTIGFPLAQEMGLDPTLTTGVVSRLSGMDDDARLLQVTAPIQPGNSGGPLLNDDGEVVGVIASSLSFEFMLEQRGVAPQNVNFAIKSELLSPMLNSLWQTSKRPVTGRGMSRVELIEQASESIGMLIVGASSAPNRSPLANRQDASQIPTPIRGQRQYEQSTTTFSPEQFEDLGQCDSNVMMSSYAPFYDLQASQSVRINRRELSLQCAPSESSPSRAILKMRGEEVLLIATSQSGDWIAISVGGVIGWVKRRTVSEI